MRSPSSGARAAALAVPCAVVLAAVALLLTAPVRGDFGDADAPRHALNGAFLLDAVRALPWRHPLAWAGDYYLHYPSLSIGFYPPLFYGVEAALYALLGVSDWVAQLAVTAMAALAGLAAWRLARRAHGPVLAGAAAILLLGFPENAFWARQVMLDLPVQALLLAAMLAVVRFGETGRTRDLVLAAAAFTAGLYVKTTIAFALPATALGIAAARGPGALMERRIWVTASVALLASLPALLLAWRFAPVMADNLGGRVAGLSLSSLANWTQYASFLPRQLGWPALLAALVGAPFLWRRLGREGRNWFAWLLLAWFASGYLIFSGIRVHEARHDLMILPPLAIAAMEPARWVGRLARGRAAPLLAGGAAGLLAVGTLAWSLAFRPPPAIEGFPAVADWVAAHEPPGGVVLFSGYRDGNFVFDLRARNPRRDLYVLRANKLLLHFAVSRKWGVTEAGLDAPALARMLHEDGVSLVIAQPGFWSDLRQMQVLESVLASPAWREVARFPISGDLKPDDGTELRAYVPAEPPASPHARLVVELPFLDRALRQAQPAGP